jgi:hypothetical protein
MFRTALPILLAAVAVAVPASASAATQQVGISDQNAFMFDQPLFQRAALTHARYFVAWNAARHPAQLRAAEDYVRRARQSGISVLVHISTDDLRPGRGTLPRPATYRREVGRLVRALRPLGVTEWGVWNEANHPSQPTWRHPERAAAYFVQMRAICRGCTIVALDVLDLSDVAGYVNRFYDALPRGARSAARLVGIHNYSDVNRRTTKGTRTIMAAVRRHTRARFWLTETGGIVELGRTFRCSPSRAANRTSYLFSLLHRYRHEIDRAYVYNWVGTGCATRMDTGMVNADGSPRPAYRAFVRGLQGLGR